MRLSREKNSSGSRVKLCHVEAAICEIAQNMVALVPNMAWKKVTSLMKINFTTSSGLYCI